MLSGLDANLAVFGDGFIRAWTKVERSYRRPFSRLALWLKFAFYPLLALGAIAWLGWDWNHARSLNSAENAIFDRVVQWRPFDPEPSGRVVVIEIDECSIEYFRRHGEGGWPWSRRRHADLLDRLDRTGVRTVGYDVLFADLSASDPSGDIALEAMAKGGAGRFVFASTRLHEDFDEGAPLHASQAAGAFALVPQPQVDPKVALLLPYGEAMAAFSAIANVTRNEDGVLRDIPLRETVGDWALPSLPLRLATRAGRTPAQDYPETVRPNWRQHARLPRVSAADLLTGQPVCRRAKTPLPAMRDRVALVGYTASGLNDAKPTPVDPVMPGVEVMAEATEALIAGSAIRAPPASVKYFLAALLVVLTTFAFFRGEPANDIDSVFVATNLFLLGTAFIGLTFFGFFFDIFASVGFISLVFGLCRVYAGVQRGRAVGHGDFLEEFDPTRDCWLAIARLRFVPDTHLDAKTAARRRREYRRRVRRFLYAGSDAVMLEGLVERKSWLHEALHDLTVLVWHGDTENVVRAAAQHDLARLERQLAEHDARLPDDGSVRLAFVCAEIDDELQDVARGQRRRLRDLIGQVLASSSECTARAATGISRTCGGPARRLVMRVFAAALIATSLVPSITRAADVTATVQKPNVDVHAQASFDSPKIATLQQNTEVKISAQAGLWYLLKLPAEKAGYVRVNDVRVAYAATENGEGNLRVLTGGKPGAGRVTETAGVRGIDESDLKSAALDQVQLDAMVGNRVDGPAASAYAAEQGWQATTVAYDREARPGSKDTEVSVADSAAAKPALADAVGGLLGRFGVNVGSKLDTAAKAMPKSEAELAAQELALGPEIAGRVLGARPLWDDTTAQQRVNRVGRWVASQTSRPELPWTFGVVDTPEINAFAAPGGYILMTRGLYQLLSSDTEVAAALGHEISHCVQRDHYNVIRQQELATTGKDVASSKITAGTGSVAGTYARQYVEKYGATVMLTTLDREAEYRSDEAAEIYLARAGMNPLALYAVLQKMAALGSKSAGLAQLYKTHPALDARLDRLDQRGYGGLKEFTSRE